MKNIIAIIFILIPLHSFAGGGMTGGATEVTQMLNNAELIPINISDASTAVSSAALTAFQTMAVPLADNLTTVMIEAMSQNGIAWLNGGLDGSAPLLISNVTKYALDKGLNEIRKNISQIPEGTTYGDAAFNMVLTSGSESVLADRIKELSKSSIPGIVQRNMCDENVLTELATNRVLDLTDSDIADQSLVNQERQALYNYAECLNDPNDNPELSLKLMDLYKQDNTLGGQQAIMAIFSGDNEYVRTKKITELILAEAREKERLAEMDVFFGQGPVSQTKCLKQEEDPAGNMYCSESAVINPSDLVSVMAGKNLTAVFDRAIASQGNFLTSLLNGFVTKTLTQGINQAITDLTGSNSSQTTVTQLPRRQDLVNDPQRRQQIDTPIIDMLNNLATTVSNVDSVIRDYDFAIASYERDVNKVKACYDALANEGIPSNSGNAYSYYNNRYAKINDVKSRINQERSKVNAARNYINQMKTRITASNSSQEKSELYSEFDSFYRSSGFPTQKTEGDIKASYTKDKNEAENDEEDTALINECNQARTTYSQQSYGSFGGDSY